MHLLSRIKKKKVSWLKIFLNKTVKIIFENICKYTSVLLLACMA